jgi:hypothetical protein
MASEPREDQSPAEEAGATTGVPRWVKIFAIIAVVVIVIVIVVAIVGDGHGPSRHSSPLKGGGVGQHGT